MKNWREIYREFNYEFLTELLDGCRTKAEAKAVLKGFNGGLSAPSKMPCHGYNLPAWECKTGSKLVKVKGSTCEGCYAMKGRYHFSNVKDSMYENFNLINKRYWKESMVLSIAMFNTGKNCDSKYFRWHDSGDLQSVEHYKNIIWIAKELPDVTFWLPTREYTTVKGIDVPSNLIVRLSAHLINSIKEVKNKKHASIVVNMFDDAAGNLSDDLAHSLDNKIPICHATRKESSHKCESCRACWDKDIQIVAYYKH
jgi:hypothetical protein